jgi:hypothetical protein
MASELEINIADAVVELSAAFRRYDPALIVNDTDVLNELFWNSPLVVRFGISENLYGHTAIANHRLRGMPGRVPPRRITKQVVTTYGHTFGTTNVEYIEISSGRRGRQSQTWLRTHEGWRIVSAHVSYLQD